jgi:hypothetical protein
MRAYYSRDCKTLSREAKRQQYCGLTAKSDNQIKATLNIMKQENYI